MPRPGVPGIIISGVRETSVLVRVARLPDELQRMIQYAAMLPFRAVVTIQRIFRGFASIVYVSIQRPIRGDNTNGTLSARRLVPFWREQSNRAPYWNRQVGQGKLEPFSLRYRDDGRS